MESTNPHENEPPTITPLGLKINSTLESFTTALHDLNSKVDNLRIDRATDHGTLIALKELTERLDTKVEGLDDKVSDLKQNVTSLGVKANTNILFQGLGLTTLIFGLFGIYNLLNTVFNSARNSTASPSVITAPPTVSPGPNRVP
jgi:hypothetical protein